MQMVVGVDPASLHAVLASIAGIKGGVRKVIVGAINDTAAKARTQIVRAIGDEVNIKRADIRKNVTVRKATENYLRAEITIKGKRLPLIAFGAKEKKRPGGGVSYKISRKGGRRTITGAFIASVVGGLGIKGGGTKLSNRQRLAIIAGLFGDEASEDAPRHAGVFMRRGTKRLPIDERMGVSIPMAFKGMPGLVQKTMAEAERDLWARIKSKMQWLIDSHSKGAA